MTPDLYLSELLVGTFLSNPGKGQRDRAITLLRHAIAHGLIQAQIDGISQGDDFKSLHGHPRFEALIAKTNNKTAASQ